ncbi:spore germination protein [Paenibacillus glufosinatiresistens]|uniref:spore germination protein n=1 Tax=Paenibacillus glufosinatiresistens TaxID=3070657 RepID=UPI00286D9CED|nr:spore germination protein [Paenibacillus sp. YX.27]
MSTPDWKQRYDTFKSRRNSGRGSSEEDLDGREEKPQTEERSAQNADRSVPDGERGEAASPGSKTASSDPSDGSPNPLPDRLPVKADLEANLDQMSDMLGMNGDLVIRRFHLFGRCRAAAVFFSSMIETDQLQDHVLKPLMAELSEGAEEKSARGDGLIGLIWNRTVHIGQGVRTGNLAKLPNEIVQGRLALLIDGHEEALAFDIRRIEYRSIEQPQTEQVIRGAREGFVEKLEPNLTLLRSRLQTSELRIETAPVGTRSASVVAVCYLDGLTDAGLVEEVMRRLSLIATDGIIDAGYIEQFIEDQPLSPFPQVQSTERPDKTAASLLEGRVALLVDGSPFALIVPALFNQFFQTIDDYSERFLMGSLIRLVRLIALFFSLFFPALYVSIISFNPELIPTEFAVAISGGRAGVPFPAAIEVLIMEVAMEVLREATIRMPQMIGGALSIVGVLVIGEAAVSAGLASPITVVIVALTTIGSFATPAYNAAIALRMLRFPLVLLAGLFGLYGVMVGSILICNHLLMLESFGVPYMSPFISGKARDLKDTLIRVPLWWMRKRPSFLHPENRVRVLPSLTQRSIDHLFEERGELYEDTADLDDPGHHGHR